MEKQEYIENEEYDINKLKEKLEILENKWFKSSKLISEIEFLKFYIKERVLLVRKLEKLHN